MLKSANKPYDKVFGAAQLTRHVKHVNNIEA